MSAGAISYSRIHDSVQRAGMPRTASKHLLTREVGVHNIDATSCAHTKLLRRVWGAGALGIVIMYTQGAYVGSLQKSYTRWECFCHGRVKCTLYFRAIRCLPINLFYANTVNQQNTLSCSSQCVARTGR